MTYVHNGLTLTRPHIVPPVANGEKPRLDYSSPEAYLASKNALNEFMRPIAPPARAASWALEAKLIAQRTKTRGGGVPPSMPQNAIGPAKLGEHMRATLDFLKANQGQTTDFLCSALGLSTSNLANHIRRIRQHGHTITCTKVGDVAHYTFEATE